MKQIFTLFYITFLCYSFSIHAQSFNHGDLKNAQILCNTAPVRIANLPDAGQDHQEMSISSCFPEGASESNTHWLRWTAANTAILNFSIVPLKSDDDIDFILIQLNDNNMNHTVLRCMGSGRRLGESIPNDEACSGATGLKLLADPVENADFGCSSGAGSFLSEIVLDQGKQYALLIHNYHSSDGVLIEFGGDIQFAPQPDLCTNVQNDEVISLSSGDLRFYDAFPNPAHDHVQVKVDLPEPSKGTCQLLDPHGRLLRAQTLDFQGGIQQINVSLEALPSGIFFLKIKLGDALHLTRIVKN